MRRLGLDPQRVHLVGSPESDDPAAWDDVAERLAAFYETLLARPRPRRRRPRVAVDRHAPGRGGGGRGDRPPRRRRRVSPTGPRRRSPSGRPRPRCSRWPASPRWRRRGAATTPSCGCRASWSLDVPETRPTRPLDEPPGRTALVDRVHRRRGLSAPSLPASDAPVASIVMVVRGAGDLALAALDSLRRHTPEPFEVVLVDNGSLDGTTSRLAAVRGARLLRNRHNRGFGPAMNQGAAEARADVVVLLNSDALVGEGWLGPLLETLDGGAGAAAPRLLNPDGSLQEAGAIVWRSGGTTAYGSGDDPERLEYRFRREIDYSGAVPGGAAGGVRRARRLRRPLRAGVLRGRRPRHAAARARPAGASTTRARRWCTWAAPRAPRSSSRRSPSATSTCFHQRWEALLDRRPLDPPDSPPWAGRDALCDERILIVDAAPTAGAAGAGRGRGPRIAADAGHLPGRAAVVRRASRSRRRWTPASSWRSPTTRRPGARRARPTTTSSARPRGAG